MQSQLSAASRSYASPKGCDEKQSKANTTFNRASQAELLGRTIRLSVVTAHRLHQHCNNLRRTAGLGQLQLVAWGSLAFQNIC
jgi:hypothetical protein